MKRDWKPGDVAILPTGLTAVVDEHGRFVYGCGEFDNARPGSINATRARPLVVIDPEDREQVERLVQALGYSIGTGARTASAQEALRSLIAPPKPDEPTTWGVVEASCCHTDKRQKWVHHPDGNWWPAWDYSKMPERTPMPDDWNDLVDPVIVREGVS